MNRRQHLGFTLLELMTAITVLAILLGIGVPSFMEATRNNRIITQTNALVSALNIARSEASKRSIPVTVCSSNVAQNNCLGTDWSNGWIVFVDNPATMPGTIDGVDLALAPLQVWPAPAGGVQFAGAPPAFVSFNADGSAANGGGVTTFVITHPDCTGTHARQITLEQTGRIRSEAVACP